MVFHIFPYYYILLFSQETRYIQRLLLHGAFDIVGFLNADWLKPCLRLSLSALRRDRLLQTHIRRRNALKPEPAPTVLFPCKEVGVMYPLLKPSPAPVWPPFPRYP